MTNFENPVKMRGVRVEINGRFIVSIVIAASAILAGISNLPTNPTSVELMGKHMSEMIDLLSKDIATFSSHP